MVNAKGEGLTLNHLFPWIWEGVVRCTGTGSLQLSVTDLSTRKAFLEMGRLGPWLGDRVVAIEEDGSGAWRNVKRLDTAPLPQPQAYSSARMLQFCHPMPRSVLFPAAHRSCRATAASGVQAGPVLLGACLSSSQLSLRKALFPCPAPRRAALALSDALSWRAFGENAASLRRPQWLPRRWRERRAGESGGGCGARELSAASRRLEERRWALEGQRASVQTLLTLPRSGPKSFLRCMVWEEVRARIQPVRELPETRASHLGTQNPVFEPTLF